MVDGIEEVIREGYTRVTTVLSQWEKYGGIDPELVIRAGERGTRVHKGVDDIHVGRQVSMTVEQGGLYFKSFLLWYQKENYVLHQSEQRIYEEFGADPFPVTGCIDALVQLPGRTDLTLIDWKTSANADKEVWPMQAQFYLHLLRQSGVQGVSRALFVKLDKAGGMPKVHEYEWSDRLLRTCMSSKDTYLQVKPWLEKRKDFIDNEYVF